MMEVNFILARSMADQLLRDTYAKWQRDVENTRNLSNGGGKTFRLQDIFR